MSGVLGLREARYIVSAWGRRTDDAVPGARLHALVDAVHCENLAGAAAEMCAVLLPVADDVQILATSREPLGVADEAQYWLPPLTLPRQMTRTESRTPRQWRCSPTGPAAPTGSSA
jgi:predicted ATPase